MTLLRRVLIVVAAVWSAANVAGAGYALVIGEPGHALAHGVLAVALGVGAWWLRRPPRIPTSDPRVEVLETEITDLRRALDETRAGLDFTERLLEQRAQPSPLEPRPHASNPPDNDVLRRDPHERSEPDPSARPSEK